ncbi:MAG TPA: hypothetical protein VJ455_04750 [Ignavibacteria bacterium]|nr:hypothetical protein [Ignavibacteria bacterium]
MKKSLLFIIILSCFVLNLFAQVNELKLINKKSSLNILQGKKSEYSSLYKETIQLKKRKTVNSYFGAGYSFIIFTNSEMNSLYPLLDTRNGTFLTDINLFFGFAIAKAVALEFEPSFLFTSSSKTIVTNTGVTHNSTNDTMAYSSNIGMFAIPITANVRFFPFFKMTTFARLFFIGAGGGMAWIKEDYDNYYTDIPNLYTGGYYGFGGISESTSQWAPLFRAMIGFTGTGGQFGFGGEVRYNVVPLKEEKGSPFVTRQGTNFNSVDINLRFYFSL